jgi:ABC transport system ATP-binding/permease protein
MSLLISLNHASLCQAGLQIIEDVSWQIQQNQRYALIGRNGAGKSTLMRLLTKEIHLDSGAIHFKKGLIISCLPQDLSISFGSTVFEDIFNRVKSQNGFHVPVGLEDFLIDEHQVHLIPERYDEPGLLSFVQELNHLLNLMQLHPLHSWLSLSGGMKRRCALAAAILVHPDVLLLDEPTNHLDIQSILWLEQYLKNFKGAVIFVTHDRVFLKNVATHIVALAYAQLKLYDDGYEAYLNQRSAELAEEENESNRMQQRLLQEEHWLQRGVTARRKRNQGRLKALMDLRHQVSERQKEFGMPGQWGAQVIRSGRVLMTAEHIGFSYENKTLIKDFSFLMMRGDKIGIVGPNGCGKTTLARILLGEIAAQSGKIQFGATIEPIYFDQLQTRLNLDESVMYNVANGAEYVELAEGKVHVAGYLKDFLFMPDQLQRPVNTLSGGEKQRLMLARCLAEKGNLMVFDEPSNDLDLESLEQLANLLVQYAGTFILISHDRALIEDSVSRLIVWESPGVFREISPSQWQAQTILVEKKMPEQVVKVGQSSSKLDYAQQKELLKLPDDIAKVEDKITKIHEKMADTHFYQQSLDLLAKTQKELEECENKLQMLYDRWDELEKQKG